MKRLQFITVLGLFLILASTIWGAVPQLINFQGILRDGSGNPVPNSSYSVVFTIDDAATAGTNLWTETQSVTTVSGLFTVLLGSVNPVPASAFDNPDRWLGVKVGADPETAPRTRLISVPFSFHALRSDSATTANLSLDLTCTGCVSSGDIADGSVGAADIDPSQVQTRVTGTAPGGQYITGINQNGTVVTAPDANNAYTAGTGLVLNGTQFAIPPNGVTSTEIANATISFSDIGQNGAGANQVMKWNGAAWSATNDDAGTPSGWADDGATVRLLTDADKVGIGTTTPTKKLEVAGSVKADTVFSNVLSSNSPLNLQAPAGTTRMFINDVSGDVGIGTASPASRLDVAGGNINLENSTAGAGNILKGGVPFIHNFGTDNTFIGVNAGNLTMTGTSNTASGAFALASNTSGVANTASGRFALRNNIGSSNTASGYSALQLNTTGGNNTASGVFALQNNTTGSNNTASGVIALLTNTTGFSNTASGASALQNNTTGGENTASGRNALSSNTTGSNNTAIGFAADVSAGNLTNATAIGNGAVVNASNKIRLGNAAVAVLECQVGLTVVSDRNQKENFRPVDGDEVLRKIRGFELSSWNYKGHDPKQFRHYGPMAQDFFAAFGNDGVGKIGTETTINSGDMAGILMIAVQALGKENERVRAENAELEARLAALENRVKKLVEEDMAGR